MSNETITIHMVNNTGSGTNGNQTIPAGKTLRDVVMAEVGLGGDVEDLIVSRNDEVVVINGPGQTGAVPLEDDDEIVIAPKNVKGAN